MPLDFKFTTEREWAAIKGFSRKHIDSIEPRSEDLEGLSPEGRRDVWRKYHAAQERERTASALRGDWDDDDDRYYGER